MKAALAAAAALFAMTAAAAAQEKVKLEVRARKGEKSTHTSTESNEGRINVSVAGMDLGQDVKETEVRAYADEVLEVDGAEATKVRRKHAEWYQSKLGPGQTEPTRTNKELAGKTIVMKKVGDKTEYEGADGVPAAELHKNRLSTDSLLTGLPKEPVAVGASWPLDDKKLKEEFNEGGDGGLDIGTVKATGSLEKIEDHKGVRCAVLLVDISGDGSIKEQKAIKMQLKLKARVWLALDTGRPLTMKGEGTGDMAGELEQDGQKIKMDGKFAFKMEGETKYE